jgi:beta-mannosidase
MPGGAPAFAPVGPWRGIRLIEGRRIEIAHLHFDARLDGADGVVSVALRGRAAGGSPPEALELRIGDRSSLAPTRLAGDGFEVEAEVRVPAVSPWWTHELGTPRRYPLELALHSRGEELPIASVQIGFRHIERLEATAGDSDEFGLRINGRDVFCRGACWTPADVVGLGDDPAEIRRVLGLVRDAGMNMLRVNGTMIYESDSFYDACDELGILVWQDFMFARMDYPEEDAEFAGEVRSEAEQVLARLHHHPCLAALCGNSEVEQQAAMMGLAPDARKTPLFESTLREASRRWCPRIPYVSSSPTGGTLPFHVDAGVAH